MHQNIQQLFSLISAAKVIAYLDQHGWRRASDQEEGIVVLGSPEGTTAEPCNVWIPTSEKHPQYRRQLPGVIFAVCLFEDRPALDVANEMYALRLTPPAEVAAPVSMSWHRFVLHQQRNSLLYVWVEPSNVAFDWDFGDRLEVLTRGGPEPARILLREDGVSIQAGEPGQTRVFLGCDSFGGGTRPTIRDVVSQEVGRLSDFNFAKGVETFAAELAPILARIEFDLPTSESAGEPLAPEKARRQIALLAATFTKLAEHAQGVLWRIAQRVAGTAELCLEAQAMASEDLWLTAADDSPEFPRQTLQWLEQHAVDPRKITT